MQNLDSYFVAKQPIIDRHMGTYGYELLFRSNFKDQEARIDDPDLATVNVISYGFIKSLEEIKQPKKIFINFTEKLLLSGAPRALPPAITVIEILENIKISNSLMDELIKYKQDGYTLAIDDFNIDRSPPDFLDIADIIKVEIINKSMEELSGIFEKIQDKKGLKLAEKVEDIATYKFLHDMGVDLFQGFFFAKPTNFSGKKIGVSQITKINALALLQKPEIDTKEIVHIINSDPKIAYRLLRLLNSAAFGFSMKIETIEHAVVLLGNTRLRYWLQMVILSDVNSGNKPIELFRLALTRGKILEELAIDGTLSGQKPETFFLFGLLSLLDIMIDTNFTKIFEHLPLTSFFKDGYLNSSSEMAHCLHLMKAFETYNSAAMMEECLFLGISQEAVAKASVRAHAWSESIANDIL